MSFTKKNKTNESTVGSTLLLKNKLNRKWLKQCLPSPDAVVKATEELILMTRHLHLDLCYRVSQWPHKQQESEN